VGNASVTAKKRAMEIDRQNIKLMNSISHAKPSIGNHILSEPNIKVSNYEQDVLDINTSFLNRNTSLLNYKQTDDLNTIAETREDREREDDLDEETKQSFSRDKRDRETIKSNTINNKEDNKDRTKGELKKIQLGPKTQHVNRE